MIVPRNILENRINFYIGTTALAEEGRTGTGRLRFRFIWEKIGIMEAGLARLPLAHLELLAEVPIIIWNGPESARGGWYPPDHRSSRWLDPARTERNFGVDGREVSNLPHANGIISITTNVLASRAGAGVHKCLFTITHEAGHCVDYHLDLSSRPLTTEYRRGNRAYQGQRYGSGYNELEFKAETYSRLIVTPERMCRSVYASPPCLNSNGHSLCNTRLQRDLRSTRAFQVLGVEINRYLPLAVEACGGEISSAGIRGLAGRSLERRSAGAQLRPHAQSRIPGSIGM
jgi:hypothetical protein